MTAPPEPSAAGEPAQRRDWVEIVATVLLAVAAVATAWSSYQANRWNGETTKATGRVNALRIDAARSQGLAQGQIQVDIGMFFQWVNADAADDPELADFYRATVPPRVPASLRRLAGDRPVDQPRGPTDTVHRRLPVNDAGADRRRPTRRRSRADGRHRPPQRPTISQLRPRRRPLRRRPVLRRDEHQTAQPRTAQGAPRRRLPRLRRHAWRGSPRSRSASPCSRCVSRPPL